MIDAECQCTKKPLICTYMHVPGAQCVCACVCVCVCAHVVHAWSCACVCVQCRACYRALEPLHHLPFACSELLLSRFTGCVLALCALARADVSC